MRSHSILVLFLLCVISLDTECTVRLLGFRCSFKLNTIQDSLNRAVPFLHRAIHLADKTFSQLKHIQECYRWIGKDVIHLHLMGNIPYYQTSSPSCLQFLRGAGYNMVIVQLTDCVEGLCLPHLLPVSAFSIWLRYKNWTPTSTPMYSAWATNWRSWRPWYSRKTVTQLQSRKHGEMTPTTGMLRGILWTLQKA